MKDIKQIINTLKYKIRYGSTVEWYNLWYIILQKKQKVIPIVASIDQTIEKIIKDHCSISRYGDGEMLLTECKSIGFQKGNPILAKRLIEILTSENEKHLIGISDAFTNLNRYNRKARRFWRTHFYIYGSLWDKYLSTNHLYYNTFVTRPYMDFASKESCKQWFDSLKQIWHERDIVFIEGEKSRLGIGNDLFNNAKSIRRILCPSQDAFNKYELILNEALKIEKGALFLIALGPTATVLAYDLFKAGYQAIDAGHVDIEYEWWLIKAKRKIRLPHKYVNEAPNGNNVINLLNEEYQKQIISLIL
ncbi:SP_1767 family glycosyltransferase [uncultured Bacteroides sp.]|uniref:SP_1767 family glycosyltransferase n=1 Tax=uncultured Bacteroides sp. TaxID=162156 RepID=UPI002AA7C877|nr:SP_1767 family glycosyltransferase [uncultured Bacteroides sp.]